MKALVLRPEKCTATVQDIPKPIPSACEILVEVRAVALNPVDSLYTFRPLAVEVNSERPRVVGSDFSGVITDLGSDVYTSSGGRVKVGDRVAGFLQGACSINHRPGAFAESLVVPWDLIWHIPSTMSFEEAATISLCALTAAQALHRLGLAAPWHPGTSTEHKPDSSRSGPPTFFIYGASTSVGLYTAQLLRHLEQDFRLIGAASTKHFDRLKAEPYAYNELVDYRSEWQSQISTLATDGGLDFAYDCISEGDTVAKIAKLVKPSGSLAVVRSIAGGAWISSEELVITPSYGAVWEGLGEEVQYYGMNLPANFEARKFAVAFYQWLSEIGGKSLKPSTVRVMPGGLDRIVEDGFQLLGGGSMQDRDVSRIEEWMRPIAAEKLVYQVARNGRGSE